MPTTPRRPRPLTPAARNGCRRSFMRDRHACLPGPGPGPGPGSRPRQAPEAKPGVAGALCRRQKRSETGAAASSRKPWPKPRRSGGAWRRCRGAPCGSAILKAQLAILSDPKFHGTIGRLITARKLSAGAAITRAAAALAATLQRSPSAYLRERAGDIREIAARLGELVYGDAADVALPALSGATILLCRHLGPLRTAQPGPPAPARPGPRRCRRHLACRHPGPLARRARRRHRTGAAGGDRRERGTDRRRPARAGRIRGRARR